MGRRVVALKSYDNVQGDSGLAAKITLFSMPRESSKSVGTEDNPLFSGAFSPQRELHARDLQP